MRTWGATLFVVVLAGCSEDSNPARSARSADPQPARAAPKLAGSCPVTLPGGDVPADGFNYGNGSIGVSIWRRGKLAAGLRPDGSTRGQINPDGSITAKLGWYRVVEGGLRVSGERLDAAAPPLAAVPAGYGAKGFQPTALTFPTTGCWKVAGSAGDASLQFVVRVVTRR
jgi:hypothetical protein